MTVQAVTSLPSGRALFGWWRELVAAQRPRRLWFGHLLLYRVEALVEIGPPARLAELCQALLPLLAREQSPFAVEAVAAKLQADVSFLGALLAELERAGLVRSARKNSSVAWEVAAADTEQSSSAPAPGSRRTRCSFSFAAEDPRLYVPLSPAAAAQIEPPAGWLFGLTALESCLAQSPQWKARHGFPAEIVRVIGPSRAPDDWRAVPLARAEQAIMALIEIVDSGEVIGYPVRPDNWTLAREAALSVPGGVEALAPLLAEADPNEWKQAFQLWCNQRNLPSGEVDACQLTLAGHRLVVRAPLRLVERLRATRSDALKGEAWLLVGAGRVKAAAQIELVESA